MAGGDIAILSAITLAFVLFAAVLIWGDLYSRGARQ
jgi:hypothetical protein